MGRIKIHIKNMVCGRCIMVVRQTFEQAGLSPVQVQLGIVELEEMPGKTQMNDIQTSLTSLGFEVLSDEKSKIVESIKNTIIKTVHQSEADSSIQFSKLLSQTLHKDYSYLSKLFSEVEGLTIEQYIIHQKIERVKELLVYDEMNLSEIAFSLGYSSVAHLSGQFKKNTGFTPSTFRKLKDHHRRPLDKM